MTVAELLVLLAKADLDAEVTIGCTVEPVASVEVVNQPSLGGAYVVLLPEVRELP